MKPKQDCGNSNLADYLLYGYWSISEGIHLLAGAIPNHKKNSEIVPLDAVSFDYVMSTDNNLYIEKNINRLWNFFYSDLLDNENEPPQFFIEWALSKRFRPDWLDWAIEQGLYSTKQDGIADKINPANNAKPYLTKWMEVQEGAIREFFNPRRNPDAKSEEVVEWIHKTAKNIQLKESNNIAEAIFSIIKPENHDPKRKRIEPK